MMENDVIYKEIGRDLYKRRKQKNLSIAEAAESLKIRKLYLKALESGDLSIIPSEIYILGYLKAYSELLETNYQQLINRLNQSVNDNIHLTGNKNKKIVSEKDFLPSYKLLGATSITLFLIYIVAAIILQH